MTRNLRTNNRHADNARRLLRDTVFAALPAPTADEYASRLVDELLLAMWDEIENEAEYRTQVEDVTQPRVDERTAQYLDYLRRDAQAQE